MSSNGHYAVKVIPEKTLHFYQIEKVLIFEECDDQAMKNKIEKLHRQFGHATSENMRRLFANAEKLNEQISHMIDVVTSDCKTCKLYKKPVPRPVVGISRATDFNHTVAMDLHQLENNLWYFHMIDEFTRYSNAVIIKSKSSSLIVKKFLLCWISLFGPPKQTFSDNGGEFVSEVFMDLSENFNIITLTSGAQTPWSNGLCER